MKRQIISRAFYGWLAYCRHLSTVRTHLSGLVHGRITPELGAEDGLSEERWHSMHNENGVVSDESEVYRLVYFGGAAQNIRKEVWPYLLGHHIFGSTPEQRAELDETTKKYYETTMSEWLAVEAIVRQRDKEKTAHAVAKLSSGGSGSQSGDKANGKDGVLDLDTEMENEVFEENGFSDLSDPEVEDEEKEKGTEQKTKEQEDTEKQEIANMDIDVPEASPLPQDLEEPPQSKKVDTCESNISSPSTSSYETVANDFVEYIEQEIILSDQPMSPKATVIAIITDASIDISNLPNLPDEINEKESKSKLEPVEEDTGNSLDALQDPKSTCASPASSNGGIYSVSKMIDHFLF